MIDEDALRSIEKLHEMKASGITRADDPSRWAMVQNNLGNALRELGERTLGANGITLLDRAQSAHRAALEVRTRQAVPTDWAATQNNLGVVLLRQGEKTGGVQGIALLDMALLTLDGALEIRTRTDFPQSWAISQNNRGLAMELKGNLTEGETRARHWRDAEAIYHGILEYLPRSGSDRVQSLATRNLARIQQKLAGPQ